jgi:hypothetical protein
VSADEVGRLLAEAAEQGRALAALAPPPGAGHVSDVR